jgi:hypothetical protein
MNVGSLRDLQASVQKMDHDIEQKINLYNVPGVDKKVLLRRYEELHADCTKILSILKDSPLDRNASVKPADQLKIIIIKNYFDKRLDFISATLKKENSSIQVGPLIL